MAPLVRARLRRIFPMNDFAKYRADFPILQRMVQGRPLVYLDNAATTQKPRAVLDASRRYYEEYNSNIHRGTHALAREATEAYEDARRTIATHIGAERPEEVVFTSGCTDSINLVAQVLAQSGRIEAGDLVLVSTLEHHSNIVPWQMLCERSGATLVPVPCDDHGVTDPGRFHELLGRRPAVVAVNWISNSFGSVHPVREIARAASAAGALVLIDAAQAAPHRAIDVVALGADFLAFSGHKMYAPTGTGVLWGRHELLATLPPWRGGGEMIREVSFAGTTYQDPPFRHEAGTPNIEGAIAMAAAVRYLDAIGMDAIEQWETTLLRAAEEALACIPGMRFFGPPDRAAVLSFAIEGVHHYDLGTLLDQMGVAVRTGHHCCQPLMARFGIQGTTRASFALYNTMEEVGVLAESIGRAVRMLR